MTAAPDSVSATPVSMRPAARGTTKAGSTSWAASARRSPPPDAPNGDPPQSADPNSAPPRTARRDRRVRPLHALRLGEDQRRPPDPHGLERPDPIGQLGDDLLGPADPLLRVVAEAHRQPRTVVTGVTGSPGQQPQAVDERTEVVGDAPLPLRALARQHGRAEQLVDGALQRIRR